MPSGELGPRFMVRGLIESLVEQDEPFVALDELRERDLAAELPEILPTPGLLLARGATYIAAGSLQLGLELARAAIALGIALASHAPAEARAALARSAALAEHLGASALARHASEELISAGGRPRRATQRGSHALTPAERR